MASAEYRIVRELGAGGMATVFLAESGEYILVTDRDRVVAELRPPEARSPLASDALLADAMRQGWVAPPLAVRHEPPVRLPVAPTAELLAELQKDCGDR